MKIKIAAIDDHRIVRDGIKLAVEKTDDIVVAAEGGNGKDALSIADSVKPDVMLLDLTMPVLDGMEAAEIIREKHPEIKIIILTRHSEKRYIKHLLEIGVAGYLLKSSSIDEILQAVRLAFSGKIFLGEDVLPLLVRDYISEHLENDGQNHDLNEREIKVLHLMSLGKTSKEIAGEMFIGVKSIEACRSQIMAKLGITSFAGLLKYAIREGISSLDE